MVAGALKGVSRACKYPVFCFEQTYGELQLHKCSMKGKKQDNIKATDPVTFREQTMRHSLRTKCSFDYKLRQIRNKKWFTGNQKEDELRRICDKILNKERKYSIRSLSVDKTLADSESKIYLVEDFRYLIYLSKRKGQCLPGPSEISSHDGARPSWEMRA